jgi:PKD repeat protein
VPVTSMHSAVFDALGSGFRSTGLWIVLGASLFTACAGGDLVLPGGEAPIAITVVKGNGQIGQVGEMLEFPLEVVVTDGAGDPVRDATVAFQITSAGAGAEISPSPTTTNAAGHAEAHMLLGDKVGLQTGAAHVVLEGATGPSATFSALANPGNPDNRTPEADFNWHCEALSCQFTNASTDDDGSVTGWNWRFGDGGTSQDAEPSHLYPAPGTYTVTLTVTDNDGATDESTADVDVAVSSPPESNEDPHADFEVDCDDMTCSFTDKSKDDDGSLVSWSWDFGDGTGSGEQNPVHTYDEEGHYDVTLTVTDNDGATDSKSHHAEADD